MNKVKHKQKILELFKNNGKLTTFEAVTELGIMSLPRRIMELRRDGYDIDMTYKRTTGGSRYGVYELHEGGEQYAE